MSLTDEDLSKLPQQNGFYLRGTEMTRLETFLDAAFAFATTMLVISIGEIPKNYPELILALKDIPSFLLSFLVIMIFWIGAYGNGWNDGLIIFTGALREGNAAAQSTGNY